MKKLIVIVLVLGFITTNCVSKKPVSNNATTQQVIKPEKGEDDEWDLEVFDSNFNYYLNAIAKPENMYSETYLKNKNSFLVREWNSYYYSGKYPNIIESAIDYDPNINYGKHFEYKLYQVFAFVSWKYGLNLMNMGSSYSGW